MDDTSARRSSGRAANSPAHPGNGRSGDPIPAGKQLHGAVVDSWGFDIVSGAIPAGTRQSYETVAGGRGVSRGVARQAARVLEEKGLLAARRRIGLTVQPAHCWKSLDLSVMRWRLNSPDRLAFGTHLMALLAAVGPSAAGLAADHATSADQLALTEAVGGISAAMRSADQAALVTHVAHFQRILLIASNNPLFAGLAPAVDQVECWVPGLLVDGPLGAAGTSGHGAVLAAIRSADSAAARAAMLALTGDSTPGNGGDQGSATRGPLLTLV